MTPSESTKRYRESMSLFKRMADASEGRTVRIISKEEQENMGVPRLTAKKALSISTGYYVNIILRDIDKQINIAASRGETEWFGPLYCEDSLISPILDSLRDRGFTVQLDEPFMSLIVRWNK